MYNAEYMEAAFNDTSKPALFYLMTRDTVHLQSASGKLRINLINLTISFVKPTLSILSHQEVNRKIRDCKTQWMLYNECMYVTVFIE